MYNVLCSNHAGRNTTYRCQHTSKSTINVCALLDYVLIPTYILINCKLPCFPIIRFYNLSQFHTRRNFRAILSIGVSDSWQPVNFTMNYCTKKTCIKLHWCIPERPTCHYTLLHTPTSLHTKIFLRHPVTCARKYHPRQKITFSTSKHTHKIHTSSYTHSLYLNLTYIHQ